MLISKEHPPLSCIHIEYHKKKIQLGHSLPTFLGRKVNPIDYQEKLCFGFTKAYRYMLNHMDEVSSTVEEFYEAKSRVILHHTQYYKMYLTASLYPEFLKNIERRRFFLHILEDENSYNNWNEYEKCSLRNLDIPILSTVTSTCGWYVGFIGYTFALMLGAFLIFSSYYGLNKLTIKISNNEKVKDFLLKFKRKES